MNDGEDIIFFQNIAKKKRKEEADFYVQQQIHDV